VGQVPPSLGINSYRIEDASGMLGFADQVFAPSTLSELQDIVASAAARNTPVTIGGAATGLTGGAVPDGGWAVSLKRFRRLEISPGKARCGAGISLQELQDEAAKTGQFFGPNPTEYSASIGGIISTNAGGARSFRFRAVRHHVLGVEATFMDGSSRWLQRGDLVNIPFRPVHQPRTRKNSAGYYLESGVDWPQLLSGSEGTLAAITEADLQLFPVAPAILSGVVFFHSDKGALDAVDEWRTIPNLRLLEFLDLPSLDFMRPLHSGIPGQAQAALLIEQDLSSDNDDEVDLWLDRLLKHDGLVDESWFGFAPQDREKFHAFRHTLAASVVDRVRKAGLPKIGTDFAVPIEHSRQLIAYYRSRCEALFPKKFLIFGHIGDANVHLNVLPDTPEEAHQGEELLYEFAKYAVSMGGTVAAEHGIGKNKRDLLSLMYSAEEIESMKAVKRTLDPQWLLGRGNIFAEFGSN
jgi:FAD/FMN-containing dehydrogenase